MIDIMLENSSNQSGQVGIAILLTMTVLLTMGLSVASRSTEDLFLSSQQSESTRVFNAAEAGIEDALSSDFNFEGQSATGTVNTISDTSVDYEVTKQNVLETRLFEGVSVKVDVDDSGVGAGLITNRNIIIDWSRETDCDTQDPASLIISVFYDDAGTTRARYYAYGACSRSDGFTLGSNSTTNYFKTVNFPLLPGDLFVRIKAVYNDTHIRVAGDGWTLPVQAYNIRSEAKNDLGNETRAVEVNKTLDAAPAIMDYALFSGTTIVK
ncbi:MAG: hypothetical protein GW941_02490 [Candidatus Pacebacteria bacterium]|nr:hypothetical protein [Candidatus Paceibacterota bacterium]